MAERNKSKSAQNSRASVPPGKLAGLTELEKRFVDHYLQTLNATQSYLAVRPLVKRSTAEANGHRLLRKAEVAQYIEGRRREMREASAIDIQRVVEQLAHIATFDPRRLFDVQGRPVLITELDHSTAAALSGLEVSVQAGAEGEISRVLRYRFSDKGAALDKLMKHLGGYERNRTDHTSVAERLQRARDRVKAQRRNP